MPDWTLQVMIGALTALPFVVLYWAARFVARRRLGAALRRPRPWQLPTLRRWVERGWLDPEGAGALPGELPPSVVFYEWAWADPEVTRAWRFREPVNELVPFEGLVRDVWANLPPGEAARTEARLREAVLTAGQWWGGAERGWNRRPLSVSAASVSRKQEGLPLLPLEDLTAAPLPGPVLAEAVAREGDGVDLVLVLAALRRCGGRFMHPLAPDAQASGSMLQGLSTRVGSEAGRRLGAGLGAVLGPIGSMVGQYLGEIAGRMGGQALAQQALPEPVASALRETETALTRLGELVRTDEFARAVRAPEAAIVELGKQVEGVREGRNRRLRERLWPSTGLVLVEEVLRVALAELNVYRTGAEYFTATARNAQAAVAGGMVLQNPWLVRALPDGVERLNKARTALNRAASALRQASKG
jgi:hypothetical protein